MKKKVNIFMVLFQHMVPILVIVIFCDWHQLSITRSALTKKKKEKVKKQRKLIKNTSNSTGEHLILYTKSSIECN